MAIRRVSLDEEGQQFDGGSFVQDFSRDGRHILFGSPSGLTAVGPPGGQGLVGYDFDVTTGEREAILVDLIAPVGDSGGGDSVTDADASVVAFAEFSDSLVPGDTNETSDVFVLDRAAGGGAVRASEAEDGTEPDGGSSDPVLAADGGQVFFSSEATNLVPGDANGLADVFVRDLDTGALANLTPTRENGTAGLGLVPTAVSADGSRLLLVADDSSDGEGTFLLDRGAGGGLTWVDERGSTGSSLGDRPHLSGDGGLALLPGDDGGLVLRDLDSGDLTTVVAGGFVDGASLSEDGRFTAFASDDDGLVAGDADGDSDVFVFDGLSGETWRVSLDENGEPFAGRDFGSFFVGEVETAPAGGFPIVAFNSDLPLVDGDTNGATDVYAIEVDAIAVADRAVTAPGTPVRIDVLANDIDLDGAAPTIAGVGPVADGTAVVEDGAVVFTPAAGFADSTSFSYTLDDGEGNQDEAIVRVQVVDEGPLVVTTAEDAVANDGQLSLREAVEAANARAGADTIGFADGLRGTTLMLEQSTLAVTDDLTIDGDPGDGGPGGITLVVADPTANPPINRGTSIRVVDADLRLEDLTLGDRERLAASTGVEGVDADVTLLRGAVTGLRGYSAAGLDLRGGSLLVQSSEISDVRALYDASGIFARGTSVRVVDSRISGVNAEYGNGIFADGPLEVVGTTVRGIGGLSADGIVARGAATVVGTTIADVSADYSGTGLNAYGALALANSTVAGVYGEDFGGGVVVRGTGEGTITNTTIAGNFGSQEGGFAGLVVEDGAELRLENSLVAGNEAVDFFGDPRAVSDVAGTVESNGRNVFGQEEVAGAAAGDVTGASVGELFAVLDTDGRPVATDNGGPTPTLALLEIPGNPAVDAADPAVAPELDQRGFARVGRPDAGSFEAGAGDGGGGLEGLPPLAEKVAVDPSLINGVDAGLLGGDGETPFTVTFLGGVGARDNALGYYVVQDEDDGPGGDGRILEAGVLFGSTVDATPGAAVQVRALAEGQTLGLFLVADGADLNGDRLAGNPSLAFFDRRGSPATVRDPAPDLFLNEPDDFDAVAGQVLHASDFEDGDRGNALNPGGAVRTLSGRGEDGSLLVAWEDQTSGSDNDFNDAIVRVEGPGLGPADPAVAEVAQPEGQPGVDVWM